MRSRQRSLRKPLAFMSLSPDDARRGELPIAVAAIVASLAASALHWHFDPLVNPDGVAYLLAAQAWLDSGYSAAAAVYPFPVYSILIALTHSVTGLSLLTSAHCLDAATLAALIVALARLGRAAGGSVRVQACIVVLALLLPELNEYRSFVLRDFGYWMLSTFALTALIRFAIEPRTRFVVAYLAAGVGGALFRTEAIALLLLMPIAFAFVPERRRFAIMLYASLATALTLVAAAVAMHPDAATSQWIVESARKFAALLADLPIRAHAQWQGFAYGVLDPRFHDYAAFGVVGGLATMVIVHVVIAVSVPLFAVAVVGLFAGSLRAIDRRAVPVLATAFAVAVAGVALVLAARGIIQTRYALPAGLLLVVVAAFAIDDALVRFADARKLRLAIGLALAYYVVEGAFGLANSKQQYVLAADWLANHTKPDARIFSDDARVVFLAGRHVDGYELERLGALDPSPPAFGDYDYVVLLDSRKRRALVGDAVPWNLGEVARFESRKGEAITIYRVEPTTPLGRTP